ncbi:Uncharacterised protein [Vibrio cholerae]|nr:Uncharacterised protein [Vibrio cholerae]
MRVETIQLFGHIRFLCQQDQLLLYTACIKLDFRLFKFAEQTLALPFQNFWHACAYFDHFGADRFQTLLNQRFHVIAFTATRGDKFVHAFIKRTE